MKVMKVWPGVVAYQTEVDHPFHHHHHHHHHYPQCPLQSSLKESLCLSKLPLKVAVAAAAAEVKTPVAKTAALNSQTIVAVVVDCAQL